MEVFDMYHSNGNYEAFVHPRKPEGIENKSAYIVGTGLAGLSAAVFLVRDAQMPGENIHILEASPIAGGALNGAYIDGHGYPDPDAGRNGPANYDQITDHGGMGCDQDRQQELDAFCHHRRICHCLACHDGGHHCRDPSARPQSAKAHG